jgi:hypothetical protein
MQVHDLYYWLGSDYFNLAMTFLSAGIGIVIKAETRHHEKEKFEKEDLAVGASLILTACVSYVTLVTHKILRFHEVFVNQKVTPTDDSFQLMAISVFALFCMLLLLGGTVVAVRRWGWQDEEKIKIPAIIVPILIGMFCLFAVFRSVGQ